MKTPPLETNSLPPDLAARFAALRTPSINSSRLSTKSTTATSDGEIEARLKSLDPPTDSEVSKDVPIQVNDQVSDDSVEKFLQSLSTGNLSPPPPPPLAEADPKGRRKPRPTLTTNSLDTLSGIEIDFMKRPTLEGNNNFTSFSKDLDFDLGGGEENELMRRMRDELDVEDRESKRNEKDVEKWEERIKGLKEGVTISSSTKDTSSVVNAERIGGEVPQLGELERELNRRKKKEEKRRGRKGSDSEDDSDSETESESDEESNDSDDDEK